VTIDHTCDFDLTSLVNDMLKPKEADIFYELFIVDANGDLIDVPVLVENLISGGETPNTGGSGNW